MGLQLFTLVRCRRWNSISDADDEASCISSTAGSGVTPLAARVLQSLGSRTSPPPAALPPSSRRDSVNSSGSRAQRSQRQSSNAAQAPKG